MTTGINVRALLALVSGVRCDASHTSHRSTMPTRRTMELVILTVILLQPAMAMVKLWMQKHIVTTGNDVTSDAARAVEQIL